MPKNCKQKKITRQYYDKNILLIRINSNIFKKRKRFYFIVKILTTMVSTIVVTKVSLYLQTYIKQITEKNNHN